jgi:hypothetical protein
MISLSFFSRIRSEYAYPDEEGVDGDDDEDDDDVEEHDRPANWGQDEVTELFL